MVKSYEVTLCLHVSETVCGGWSAAFLQGLDALPAASCPRQWHHAADCGQSHCHAVLMGGIYNPESIRNSFISLHSIVPWASLHILGPAAIKAESTCTSDSSAPFFSGRMHRTWRKSVGDPVR